PGARIARACGLADPRHALDRRVQPARRVVVVAHPVDLHAEAVTRSAVDLQIDRLALVDARGRREACDPAAADRVAAQQPPAARARITVLQNDSVPARAA